MAFDYSAMVVVFTTFLAASSTFLSIMGFQLLITKQNPGMLHAVNGIIIGLIVIAPVAGFVSPASAVVLGFIASPLYLAAERVVF